jgi:16S rRNA (guanine527-N7)-methyltransferase
MTGISAPLSLADRLPALLSAANLDKLNPHQIEKFDRYLAIMLRWNARTNLTAVRDPDAILRKHFVESIACAQFLPREIATLLDFGSGAGLPGIPIAISYPGISVTLAESQGKKAAFLREAIRVLDLKATVHGGRAESLALRFDCVTLRAVDRMEQAVAVAANLVAPHGWLAPLTTRANLTVFEAAAGGAFSWQPAIALPGGDERVLALGRRFA